jgi:hypothetical protein
MLRRAAIVLVAACGSAAPPPLEQRTAPAPPRPAGPQRFIQRQLSVGTRSVSSSLGIWELTIDGNSATLVETAQQAAGGLTIERADREARWKTIDTHVERGPAHRVRDHLALDLESKSDSLWLRCWHRSLAVATAGAHRVARPGHEKDCSDPGEWSPAKMVKIDALVCGQGEGLDDGQLAGMDGTAGSLDETLFRFAPAPGVETVEESDDCLETTGLRLAR